MKPKQLHITVTQSDIERGKKLDPWDCPVARALRRASKERSVSAGMGFMFIGPKKRRILWQTPPEVRAFISDFDGKKDVKPFEFDMPLKSNYPDAKRLAEILGR